MKTEILYEDQMILVVRKPAGLPTQTNQLAQIDVVSELKNYLGNDPYLGVIHRLDQPVEGILVFAKNQIAAKHLSKQLTDQLMHKEYLVLVKDTEMEETGIFKDYLLKDGLKNISKVVEKQVKDSKYSELSYKVLGKNNQLMLLEIKILTGRHHQIRVQLAHHNLSIIGDQKYGNDYTKQLSKQLGIHNISLCATRLEFLHPETNKKMEFIKFPEFKKYVEEKTSIVK